MTSATRGSAGHDTERGRRGCRACGTRRLDAFSCVSQGVKARAEYDAKHTDGPTPVRYEATRTKYGTARNAARGVLVKVRTDLEDITEKIRCQFSDPDVIEALERAWGRVRRRLRACADPVGCCLDDECDDEFDTDVTGKPLEVLSGRIAQYEKRTGDAEDCFDRLEGEPDRLTERVGKLRAEVDKLIADFKKDEAEGEPLRLFAAALLAQHHLDGVWAGFPHAHDFVDCLCDALERALRGRAALSELVGELAVRTCMTTARVDRCEELEKNIVGGIIEEYVRGRQPHHPHDEDDDHDHQDDHQDEDEDYAEEEPEPEPEPEPPYEPEFDEPRPPRRPSRPAARRAEPPAAPAAPPARRRRPPRGFDE